MTASSTIFYLLDFLPFTIAILDQEGNITHVNKLWGDFAAVHGDVSEEYLKNNYLHICKHASGRDEVYGKKIYRETLRVLQGESPYFSMEYPCQDTVRNVRHYFSIFVIPLEGTQGAVMCHIDIGKQKLAEKKWAQSSRKCTKLTQELNSVVYRLSHDLKSPLSTMLGLIEIIDSMPEEKPNLPQYLLHMQKCIQRMELFIANMLDYAYNENKQVTVSEIVFKDFTEEVFEKLPENMSVWLLVESETTPLIRADRNRLEIILSNLLSNAIKYRNSQAELCYVKVQLYSSRNQYILEVEDNGIGIEEEYQSKVFDMFYRATLKDAGSGLGLYLVREVVTNLKGFVEFTSVPGKGTKFTITLPMTHASQTFLVSDASEDIPASKQA